MFLKSTVLACVCFVLFLAAHFLVFHYLNPKRKFRSILFTAIFFCGVYAALFVIVPDVFFIRLGKPVLEGLVKWLGFLYLYLFAYYFYFHSIVVLDRSISVRMLIEIFFSVGGKLDLKTIKQRYSLDEKFSDEIRDMLFIKRFEEDGGSYRNTWRASLQARIFQFLKKYLNLSDCR